ncbi:MAG TPA: PAS domain S-box protein [Rhodocyclaceae bacterium]|nr:PAS domain S-box protein [Rhodocyclaceae bacterium]
MPPTSSPFSQWSVRTFLAWLVLACLLPGVIGAIALFIYQYREGRAEFERSTIQTARALVQAVDHHLLRVQTLALILAADEALARQDFARFHRHAREAIALSGLATNIVVRDRSGRQLVNTAIDIGRPLLATPAPEQVRGVFETGRPTISDVFIGPVLRRPVMSVDVPVFIDGKVAYAVGAGILPEQFNAILQAQNLPPDWIAGVVDRTGTLLGRTHAPETFVGQKATDELLRRLQASPEGSLPVTTGEGTPVLAFYSRSAVTGWGVLIGVPRQALNAAFGWEFALLALGVAALFGVGLILAWLMGGRLAGAVNSLIAPALALGDGGSAPVPSIHVKEAAEVAEAIARAADLLKERAAIIEARNTELAEAHMLAKFGTWHWNLESGEVTASESMRRIFGRELPPFRETRGTLLTVESWEKVKAASQQAVETGGYDLELQAYHANGSALWVRAKCAAVRDAQGRVVALRGALQDITEQKRAERALQDSERRLALALEAGRSAVWELDVATGALTGDERLYSMYGYGPDQLKTLADWEAIVHDEDRPGIAGRVDDVMQGKTQRYSFEARIRCSDGSWRWNLTEALVAERDARGQPLRVVGTHSDIDARKRAEESLRQERSRLQAIIDNSPLLIMVKDLESRVVLANKAIYENLQVPPREKLIGHTIFEAFPQDVAEARWVNDLAAMAEDGMVRAEETIRHVDGTWHTYVTVRFPVHDIETDALIGVCAISTDISDRKEAEAEVQRLNADLERRVEERTAELERANDALLHSNMELRHFAHATAHDLQTPLRSIAGFAQLLQREVGDMGNDRVQEYSSLVIGNTKRLQTLIESLLAYTRLDTQGLPFEPVDMGVVAEEVISSLAFLIRETGAEVRCGPLPTVAVDRIQMAQVLQNLIENGIKYNRSEIPRISITGEFQQDRWLFSVTDNGVGIDPKFHARIFEVFRRLHSYQQVAGSGIGLALCRRIVERHGGRIWVESRPGEGSTFYFTLPAGKQELA